MARTILLVLFTALLVAAPFDDADARRGGGRVPVVVPGTSSSDIIEKVLDLPDIADLLSSEGQYIDLGYLHYRDGGGEWIGYIGSSRTYYKLSKEQLDMMLASVGLDEPPAVPTRWWDSGGWGFLYFILFISVLTYGWRLLKGLTLGAARASGKVARTLAERESTTSADWSKVEEQLARAAETKSRLAGVAQPVGRPAPQRAPFSAPSIGRPGIAPASVAVGGGFGRRGR